jgi:hypothetical protein
LNEGQITEITNRNEVTRIALANGFNVFLPIIDDGVDLILYRESDGATHPVQLKSRWTIAGKYEGRGIWIAFPSDGVWYLMPHEAMVEHARLDGATETESWRTGGVYHRGRLSANQRAACAPYVFALPAVE